MTNTDSNLFESKTVTRKKLIRVFGWIFFLPLLAFNSCNIDRKNNSRAELDSLINANSNSLIFLHFWSGISDRDFNRIVDLENERGILNRGKFYFQIREGSDSVGLDIGRIDIGNGGSGIILKYDEEVWVKSDGRYPPSSGPPSWDGNFYRDIKESLKKHFDSKYAKVDQEQAALFGLSASEFRDSYLGLMSNYAWIGKEEKEKMITMSMRYNDRSYDPAVNNRKGDLYPITWQYDAEKGLAKWADCHLSIEIMMLQDFVEQHVKGLKDETLLKEKEEVEKKKVEEKVKEKNNKL